MLSIIVRLGSYVYWYLRPLMKWFLRKTTRLCELQRICYGEDAGYPRSSKIEMSLSMSRTRDILEVTQQLTRLSSQGRFRDYKTVKNCLDCAVNITLQVKHIKPQIHMPFVSGFRSCLCQIYGYQHLIYEAEVLRTTPYDSSNKEHEEKLLKLWSLLKPDTILTNRISKDWTDIGFQGEDPKTDFRGMGILGLENLLYFATHHSKVARHVLLHSNHPKYGYSFAIVGINLTSMAYQLLKDQNLKVHLFNTVKGLPTIDDFHYIYCYLFYEFDKFWLLEKPRDIMEFNRIRTKFQSSIVKHLEIPKAKLKLSFIVETL